MSHLNIWEIITGNSEVPPGTSGSTFWDYIHGLAHPAPPAYVAVVPTPGPCGVGASTILPGDPDLNTSLLTAVAMLGGARITWTYPGVLPHAVAHTQLFRNTVNDFGTAGMIAIVSGNTHFDNLNVTSPTNYYYWIKLVSIQGTVGDLIGPAWCTVGSTIAEIIAGLEGQIGDSALNVYLKERIDSILDISSGLSDEQQARLLGDTYLNDVWDLMQVDLDAVDTLIDSEILTRVDENSAMAAQVSIILAQANGNAAAIAEEQLVRADADSATALQVLTLQVEVDDLVTSVQVLALADSELGAMYAVKLDVNGFVSGYGIYSDPLGSSLFLVNADRFAIGKPGATTNLPFIVSGGVVYIKSAMIENASITNAKIGSEISSDNYDFFTTGWGIHKSLPGYPDGVAVFHDIIARGNIEATSIKVGTLDVVDTLMIQGNAVTVPASAVSSVTLSGTVGTWVTAVTSPAITVASGQPIQVQVSAEVTKGAGSGQSLFRYRLKRGGTVIYTTFSSQGSRVYADESELICFNYQDIPGAGAQTYTLEVTRGDAGAATMRAENASITVTGLKR